MKEKVKVKGEGGERTVDIESGLVHAETVIQTVATLGNGALICRELADEAVTALKVIPAIRAELKRTAKPTQRWELYKNCQEADAARAAEKVIMSVTWAFVSWLYMDVIDGESRLDYLRRCDELRILKQDGYREIKKLEKEAAKKGGAK